MVLKKTSENIYEIPKEGKMKVPGVIYASEKLIEAIKQDKTLEQVKNVAMLPGIVEKSIALADAHQGYGFCVGGVAAFDIDKGIISPGGIGYDINCGVRLLITDLKKDDLLKKRQELLNEIYKNIPSGVGRGGEFKFSDKEIDEILRLGARYIVEKGYGEKEDIEKTEDNGCIKWADSSKVSQRAKSRGRDQLGTIGAGNHFVEVQEVDKIFDEKTAEVFGIKKGQIAVMIHTGSRGLGHQTASDYIQKMEREFPDVVKKLPDRELACAPIESPIGKDYRAAMAAAANFAFTNRQLITNQIRKSFKRFFPKVKISVVYDIAHNIAKFEDYEIKGKKIRVCVHRKGATRSFGPGRKEIPKDYRKAGQPIFIPGSMGTYSYVLVGTEKAKDISFSSTAHGAGRVMSRASAKRTITQEQIKKELEKHDVAVKAGSVKGMIEEAPKAYKDVDEVVRVIDELGISKKVAKLKPLLVIKG